MPDAVVIAGDSLGGLALAAALARGDHAGRVTVVAEPAPPSRRLIAGCSLRRGAVARLASAFGVDVRAMLDALTGNRGIFHRVTLDPARMTAGGEIVFEAQVVLDERPADEPAFGVSSRHGEITRQLRRLVEALPVRIVERRLSGIEGLGELARGDSLLVNATQRNLFGAPDLLPPRHWVIAVQAPFVAAPGGIREPLREGSCSVPLIDFGYGVEASLFTPFYDSASPRADWYGINVRLVAAADLERERDLASARAGLDRLAERLGLVAHDPDETLGAVVIPVAHGRPAPSRPGTFEATRAFSSGAPAIYADGMLAAATGARAFAAALREGPRCAETAVARSLRGIRFRNWLFQLVLRQSYATNLMLLRSLPGPATALFRIDWLA